MQSKGKLNILNGQAMYNRFKENGFLKHEVMIPFNEAMCYGDTSNDLFSDDFIAMRAKIHHVTLAQYEEITLKPLQPLFNKEFTHLALWFDFDMFCQINILTILAWLDQENYLDLIDIHFVDDHFEALDKFTVGVKGYHSLYTQVLINKTMPQETLPAPLQKRIELYLNYLDHNGELMIYIKEHKHVPKEELVSLLLRKFKDYGLGDIQYLELIHNSRKLHN